MALTLKYLHKALFFIPAQVPGNWDLGWMYWTAESPDPGGVLAPAIGGGGGRFSDVIVCPRTISEDVTGIGPVLVTIPIPAQSGTPNPIPTEVFNATLSQADPSDLLGVRAWYRMDDATDDGGGNLSAVANRVSGAGFPGDLVSNVASTAPLVTVSSLDAVDLNSAHLRTSTSQAKTAFRGSNFDRWHVFMVLRITTAPTLNSGSLWTNHRMYGNSAGWWGAYARQNGGDEIYGYNWDGNADIAVQTLPLNQIILLEHWKEAAGDQFFRINNAVATSVATGSTGNLANTMNIGEGLQGELFEFVVCEEADVSATRDAVRTYFGNRYGMSV